MPDNGFSPILSIVKFWYADAVRTIKRRTPGACITLKNTAPNQGEGERIRRGYASYTTVATPTGMQILKTLPVQIPSTEDIHLWFASSSGQKVYQSPYWFGSTKQTTNIQINETFGSTGTPFDPTNGDVSFSGQHQMSIANLATTGNAAALGFNSTIVGTTDYFTNFVVYNVTKSVYALCKQYTQSGGTGTFKFVETIDSSSQNWAVSDTFVFYRNFHNNLTFAPAYNTTLTDPPAAVVDNSELYWSGGQSSATGNLGLFSKYINRTFFPADTLNKFTFTGTYIGEERLKAPGTGVLSQLVQGNFGNSGLETNKTYWIGLAFVYDGFQIGELQRFETLTSYSTGGAWTRNYLSATTDTQSVASVAVTANGSNYVNAGVTFSGGGGSGAAATPNTSGNSIVSVNVTNGGTGYGTAPTVAFTSGVASVTVTNPGTNYANSTTCSFSGGGGTGAAATVQVAAGLIIGITMTNYGSGYTSAPTITLANVGSGTGAAFTVNIGSGATATASLSTSTTVAQAISLSLTLSAAQLDKRITGINIYAAQDAGQTTVRQNQYFFIKTVPLTVSDGSGVIWAMRPSDSQFVTSGAGFLLVDGNAWNAKGNTYVDDSGIEEIPTDSSYSYSQRIVVGEKEHRHIISNVYVTSEGVVDRQSMFTNPIGANAQINSGVVQRSMFSNELGFYRLNVQPTIGTKINDIRVVGLGELLVLKDRGIIFERLIIGDDGVPDLIPSILDHNAGCSTIQGAIETDDGYVYFPGYEDIYRYRGGGYERLIERADQQDWLDQYRVQIGKTAKEGIAIAYLPEGILFLDINQSSSNGGQYQHYTQFFPEGWRQFTCPLFFKYFTKLQNGTLLAVSTEATPAVYQFSNPSTGAYYYSDAGTAIKTEIDTGDLTTSGSPAYDTVLDRITEQRYFDSATAGTKENKLYRDGSLQKTYTAMDKTSGYLRTNLFSDDPHIGNTWRIDLNTNASPEVLGSGVDFRLIGLHYWGHVIPRQRVSESNYSTVNGVTQSNTVQQVAEVTLNRAVATFTWDRPFTKTYNSPTEGAGTPSYVIKEAQSPFVIGSDRSEVPLVTISARTLTTFDAYASEDNVKFAFEATE